MSPGQTDLDSHELRALVREVLLAAIPDGLAAAGAAGSELIGTTSAGGTDQPPAGQATETGPTAVALTTDADLSAFVQRIAADCADPQRRAQLASGRVLYTLAGGRSAGAAPGPGGAEPAAAIRVERGAVTERHVREAARSGTAIVAARGVVITPLARDRARTSGVDIEKEH